MTKTLTPLLSLGQEDRHLPLLKSRTLLHPTVRDPDSPQPKSPAIDRTRQDNVEVCVFVGPWSRLSSLGTRFGVATSPDDVVPRNSSQSETGEGVKEPDDEITSVQWGW